RRIDPLFLKKILTQEFIELELDLDYSFGVFDNFKKKMIILNGYYLADVGNNSRMSNSGLKLETLLKNSEFKIGLFPSITGSPGTLKVIFPYKTSWLWRSVW